MADKECGVCAFNNCCAGHYKHIDRRLTDIARLALDAVGDGDDERSGELISRFLQMRQHLAEIIAPNDSLPAVTVIVSAKDEMPNG